MLNIFDKIKMRHDTLAISLFSVNEVDPVSRLHLVRFPILASLKPLFLIDTHHSDIHSDIFVFLLYIPQKLYLARKRKCEYS